MIGFHFILFNFFRIGFCMWIFIYLFYYLFFCVDGVVRVDRLAWIFIYLFILLFIEPAFAVIALMAGLCHG
jgi:hypothetical protein